MTPRRGYHKCADTLSVQQAIVSSLSDIKMKNFIKWVLFYGRQKMLREVLSIKEPNMLLKY